MLRLIHECDQERANARGPTWPGQRDPHDVRDLQQRERHEAHVHQVHGTSQGRQAGLY